MGNVCAVQRRHSLQFNNNTADHHVCQIIANDIAVFVNNLYGDLCLNINALLAQTMCKRILVNLLKIAYSQIQMNGVGRLSYCIANHLSLFVCHIALHFFVSFVAKITS